MAIYIGPLSRQCWCSLYTFAAVLVHHSHDHHQCDRCLEIFSWGQTVSIGASQETRHLCVNASVYVETLSDWIWKQFSSSLDWLPLTEQSSSRFDDHSIALGDNQFFKKMNNFFEWIIFKFVEWIFCWIFFL